MSTDGFRPDVEGLRAVGIGTVLLAHAGLGFARGGFVGVDVFFVISGFLITRLLVAELEATGRLALARFYARRIKRLMPQALTAIVVVALVARFLLSPVAIAGVTGDVTAAGAYAMNWHLAAEAVDYFASGAADGPLDHFWSLAVEEQFYLVWPLLLIVLMKGGRRLLAAGLGAIATASLLHAVGAVAASPEQAYFSTATRAWELALGGLLPLALADRRLGRRAAAAAAWAGAAAIAIAVVTFDAETAIPALPALLPTLGAAALLAAGTSAAPTGPTRALTLRPVRFVGRVSYAWYVWHWPVLIFASAAWGPLTAAEGLAATAASFVPTVVTFRLIEEPIRRSRIHVGMPRITLAAAPAAAAVALASAAGVSWSMPADPPGLHPAPRYADADRGRSFYDGCLAGADAVRSPACVYGDRASQTTVVLFGDSHAMQWFPALEAVAAHRGWRLVELTKAGCPPSAVSVVYAPERRSYPECDAWREHALDRIRDAALVVVAGSVQYRVVAGGRRLSADASMRALAAGYAPMLRRLGRAAGRVAVLADTPQPPWDVPDCVSARRRCSFPRRAAVAHARIVTDAVRRLGVEVIDPAPRFCGLAECASVIGNVLVYRNSGHITATYARTLSRWLERRLS